MVPPLLCPSLMVRRGVVAHSLGLQVPPLLCSSLMVRRGVVAHSLELDGAPIAMLKPDGETWWHIV